MNWKQITELLEIDDIIDNSFSVPQVIFKHSTRCSISAMAKSRLEKNTFPEHVGFHILDLIKHRSTSNHIEKIFGIPHESPQVLIIRKGTCIYDQSHSGIHMKEILEQAGE